MEPRLKTSKKWTPLPKDFLSQIRTVFKETFKAQIGKGVVETDGRIYPEEILVSVGFRPDQGLRQSNFEVSIAYKKDKDNVLKLLHMAVDAAASLFEQFFAAEDDQEFPRIWQEFEVDGRMVYAQYTTTNTELESEADRLLGVHAKEGLAGGDWDEDVSPEDIKATLGIDPDEEDLEDPLAEMLDDVNEDEEEKPRPKKKTLIRLIMRASTLC
ncbi:MAG: hypothetical protein HC883_04530 [Bdellovibrionaceae bacterium]|nr:hypothetical protein [Pseudobdellovibrionaceae bacterium]